VVVKVIATDRHGDPVTDLRPADLRVLDDNSPQRVTSLKQTQDKNPLPIVILFDFDTSICWRGMAGSIP
jgi:hypothetical protein